MFRTSTILRQVASSTSSFRLPSTIKQLFAENVQVKTPITVHGWVKSVRRQKKVTFAVITDGSTGKGLQAVFTTPADEGQNDASQGARSLTNGSSVRLTGTLVPSPGKGQDKELLVEDVQILGKCEPDHYPIQKQNLSNEYLRDHAHLRARTDGIAAMLRLRGVLGKRISSCFDNQGFTYTHTPILTANDAEGAGEAFRIAPIPPSPHPASLTFSTQIPAADTAQKGTHSPPAVTAKIPDSSPTKQVPQEFFTRPSYLTVSHQLHLEALTTALSRVYTLSPCFRAERSLTGRHLAEFWMLEAEWAFAGTNSIHEVCDLVEGTLRDVVGGLLHSGDKADLDVLWKANDDHRRRSLEDAFQGPGPWTRMTYTEAVKELQTYHASAHVKSGFHYEPAWGRPLQSEHERWLAQELVKGPLFVTDYPASQKPFYMRLNGDKDAERQTVACFDLLVPHVGELAGGSVREERLHVLTDRMRAAGMRLEPLEAGVVTASELKAGKNDSGEYDWYLDLRRWGGAPHAGFGMGFERLVGWVGGIDNVRECVPMPRWAGRMVL